MSLPSLAVQHVIAQSVQTIVLQDCGFHLPVILPMPEESDLSWLLVDASRATETATYRHKVTGERVTFGWLDCTSV